ncbi:hypothetical protein [Streptomyces sp. SAS_260]|uniref:hypothetical protein n=1 Tax=Streptomyces sp. SAS_260 TaxID=3412751 RepID=UPI00403D35A4
MSGAGRHIAAPPAALLVLLRGAAFGAVPLIGQVRVTRALPRAPDAAPDLLVSASRTFPALGSPAGGAPTGHRGTTAAFAAGSVVVPLGAPVVPQAGPGGKKTSSHLVDTSSTRIYGS